MMLIPRRVCALLLGIVVAAGCETKPKPAGAEAGGGSGGGSGGHRGTGGQGAAAPAGSGGHAGSGVTGGAGGAAAMGGSGGAAAMGGSGGAAEVDAGVDQVIEDAASSTEAGSETPVTMVPPLGMRWSFEEVVASRWVGTRRTTMMEDGRRIFTAGFEAGKFGGNGNGHITRIPIAPGREYIFEYRLRFDSGFDFSRGGKIPGLQGASAPSGCKRSDGTGFSARQMWREGGRLISYIYDMDQSGACGNTLDAGLSFQAGTWYQVKMRVKLNTGRNHDGIYELWVNDRRLLNRTTMGWMIEAPDRRIDDVMLDLFFGGSTADWAPSRNCSISFSDMYLTRVAD